MKNDLIYVDSNVFIYSIISKNEKIISKSKDIILSIAKGNVQAITSLLTWDEFARIVQKHLGYEYAVIEGGKFLNMPCLNFIDVNFNVINKAQEIMKTYRLNPRDSIHAATAIMNNATKILTNDTDFDNLKELKRISVENFKAQ